MDNQTLKDIAVKRLTSKLLSQRNEIHIEDLLKKEENNQPPITTITVDIPIPQDVVDKLAIPPGTVIKLTDEEFFDLMKD